MKNLLHRKSTCFLLTPLFFALAWAIWSFIIPTNEKAQEHGGIAIIGVFSILLWVASIGAGIGHFVSLFVGADYSCIDFSKPHRAVLSKDSGGKYFVGVCRFPFWTDVTEYACKTNTEENVVKRYEELKENSEAARQKKLASGPVRVLAEPSGPKISSASDAYKHIESILEQYAPEKVDAIRKLKEVFEK